MRRWDAENLYAKVETYTGLDRLLLGHAVDVYERRDDGYDKYVGCRFVHGRITDKKIKRAIERVLAERMMDDYRRNTAQRVEYSDLL